MLKLLKRTRVVLLRPPDPMGMVDVLSHVLPTNIGYIAGYIQREGFEVQIWDYEQDPFVAVDFLNRVKEFAPDIIGISCMTPTIINGGNIATLVKKHFPTILTVVGGAHSSALPEQTLEEFPDIDLVVNQEGEATFLELCQRVETRSELDGLFGITRRDGDGFIREPGRGFIDDLDSIPFPARELYQTPHARRGHVTRGVSNELGSAAVFTSRGCPYKCTFCAIVATFDRTVRFREPAAVFEEVKDIRERFNIDHVVIGDDTFGLKKGRMEALCEGFGSIGLGSWSCDTRVHCVNKEILKMMKDTGCTKVAFGIETGSERVTELNQKKINIDNVREAVRWANEIGIKNIEGNFIVGSHPDETYEDLKLTEKLIRELPLTFVSISVLVPYPGTPNFDYMKEKGHIYSEDWSKYVMFGQTPSWRTTHFEPDELLRHQRRLNRVFYLNPRYMTRMLLRIRDFRELAYYVKAGRAFIRWSFGGDIPNGNAQMDLNDSGFHLEHEHVEHEHAVLA